MVRIRSTKPLAFTLFTMLAMAILISCSEVGTTESAKSSGPNPASNAESPLAAAVTKAIGSQSDEQQSGPASAIALLIQAAELQAAPVDETITKVVGPVLEELVKAATSEAEELAERIARALEAEEPLLETLKDAAEAMFEGLTDTSATLMFDDASSDPPSVEDLVMAILEDGTALSLLSETLPETLLKAAAGAGADQESAGALVTTFDQFGFTLTMDLGSEVQTAQGSAGEQGAISFPLGEVNSVLT